MLPTKTIIRKSNTSDIKKKKLILEESFVTFALCIINYHYLFAHTYYLFNKL